MPTPGINVPTHAGPVVKAAQLRQHSLGTQVGCKGAGMRMCKQLVAQRLWHHQLDGIAIPPDQHLILKEDGGPQGPEFSTL